MSPSNLCKVCTHILTTNDHNYHSHHQSASELVACPCSLCKILCDGLRHSACRIDQAQGAKDENFMNFHYHIGLDGSTEGAPMTILFTAMYPNRKKTKGAAPASERFFHQKILVVRSDAGHRASDDVPSTNTGSESSWRVATNWLETCMKKHSKCAQNMQPTWVPTRLLDVGTQDLPSLCLQIMDHKSPKDPYVTLSHCWGNVKFLQLLEINIDAMVNRININDLPKTFQDAIKITRLLGVKYLWIDSLCIIQQSTDDWAREASMMGHVYQNGLCNIAATGAPDGRRGCFMDRDPILAQKCHVRVEKTLSKFNLKPGIYELLPKNLWENELFNAPLNKRAWVTQERILAPRVLHFCSNQLFWECNGLDACEIYPNGAPQILSGAVSTGRTAGAQEFGFKRLHFKNLEPATVRAEIQIMKTPFTVSLMSPLPSGPLIDPYYVWNKILLAYTRCALTNEEDQLVAISAVAKKIQAMARDDYFAGMWRRYLEYHLLWHTDQRDPDRARTKPYVAPSWSWASMTSRVEPYIYIRTNVPFMIQILDIQVQTETPDMMGQVSGGCLELRGWLRKLPITKDKPKSRLGMPDIKVPQLADAVQLDESRPTDVIEAWFLPILAIGPWLECEVLGLILLESEGNDYRRIGRFRANGDVAKTFRRPRYPLEGTKASGQRNEKYGSGSKGKEEKRGWFGMKKKMDEENAWTERIIKII